MRGTGVPFKPGMSGNPRGRPKGSRHKLSELTLTDLVADWEEHGVAAIASARQSDPVAYIRVIASLLPKQIEKQPNPLADLTVDELDDLDRLIVTMMEQRQEPQP